MVGRDSTPAPGSYNIDTLSIGGQAARVSKLHKGDAKSGAAFSASEKRLRADQIFGQKMNPTPGPGDYTTDRGTLAKKVRPRRAATTSGIPSRDGFGGSTVRFQKDAPSLGSLGAGYDPNSMVKKSFNRKAGYVGIYTSRSIYSALVMFEVVLFVGGLSHNRRTGTCAH